MSKFFIDRPIFAWVIALVIMLVGALSISSLPINQYPSIAPPAIDIQVTYPGASAQTVQDTVVQVIEQQLNGIDNLRYVSSESNSDGSMTITATFNQGTNPDTAQVQVQNKLNLATPLLPQEVQQQGIRVTKAVKNFLMVIGLVSEDGSMGKEDLANYIVSNMQDPISRTSGVGDFQVFGSQYAMRIWLDPAKLNNFQLTPVDVKDAITAQNVQVSSGQLGGLPSISGQQLNATIIGKTRLQTAEQFGNIFLKVNTDGSQVRLKDVATVGLGAENYSTDSQFDGKPASGLAIKLATGANALDTAKAIRATVSSLEPFFPPGMKVVYPYDTTPVVSESINGVVHTLIEAIVLVFLVMYLFLQNFRATVITTMTVPVVLLGTFGILAAFGFTINTLTMFGMVLAIGLLVDDAIVVVENVERVMEEEKLSPRDATIKSMTQIQGALVGIALVLSAVLLPMAFFGGSTGVIYKQFSITIVSAMALSVVVALIFTPALCATMLKPIDEKTHGQPKRGFFGWFNRTFDRSVLSYERGVGNMLKHKWPAYLGYILICAGMVWMFMRIPAAFLPEEDQGVIFAQIQTPAGSSTERTQEVIDNMREYLLTKESGAVKSVFSVNGFNFAGRGQSSAIAFVMLKPWEERDSNNSVFELAKRAQGYFFSLRDAMVFAVVPPSVLELGNATGFDVYLQDQGGVGHDKLMEARNQFLGMASQSKILAGVRPNGLNDEPQYQLIIDDERASALGITLSDINNTLSIALGGSYVNDFIDRGRVKKVYIQGDAGARMTPEDLKKWYVRNSSGEMVPFSAFASGKWAYGSPKLSRYNGVAAEEVLGTPAPGYSSGEAMAEVEALAKKLPQGIGISWTGLSYEERLSGSQAPALYALSLLVVFLCLAALYESWSIPIAVILVVPLGVIGALMATSLRGLSNDVFFQVGLLVTVGLAAKNAILIVEFAKELHEQGKSLVDSAIEACRMRLRPIIMTSMAFILGVVPLAISTGAGSGSQHSIGTGVIGGMITAVILAIFWVPLFFVSVSGLFKGKQKHISHDEAGQ
ncbi:Inner membrane efflux transporter of RND family multidrug efflux pump [Pseudomonas syringae pv. helianthi]|uniref:Efflux pump membrane transporter n=1 Tax=Pseudomonas syringae pv. helianthi TaxID=251654 RepID=A0A0P9S2S8_9PSED|nr:efflux RND transporter permease subunit [Pseudomonas syringae group genomosp. 7]KPX45530.1 Inner membrane efflux transporter of RND family multidrug efflux pump [Pseudomonas syringae pv. helianthi]RMR09972.1 Inner membrane efflux transporter of RND family multidrug efflux pump [Pseudomonas syringae pv. helianthi]RMV50473.1 Multidrug/solvent transporter [Pseudomonas syringae pv. helianthi]UNB64406.1 efflux RND transporter permease subunit [Pseudomonas syringae pv. helianthi]